MAVTTKTNVTDISSTAATLYVVCETQKSRRKASCSPAYGIKTAVPVQSLAVYNM